MTPLLVLTGTTSFAFADAVRGIRTPVDQPIAPRGGVMMLPLSARQPGDNWPATITLKLADGTKIAGSVVWIEPRREDPPRRRRWTDDPSGLLARPVRPEDDSSVATAGAPWLLAALPGDADGPIRFQGRNLQPIWCDPHTPPTRHGPPGPDRPTLEVTDAPDRPDPDSPFEHWRWVLLADRLDLKPPPPDRFDEAAALLARHNADLWRIGLARLAGLSQDAATACRDLLTRTCTDRAAGVDFAVWVADPADLRTLQATLLDFRKPDETVRREARAWADSRSPLLLWPEASFGDQVRLAVVNRSEQPVVGRLAWQVADEVPIAVEFEPGMLTRVLVDRPPPPEPDPFDLLTPEESEAQALELRAGLQVVRTVFGRRCTRVRPPGIALPPARPALTLAEAEARRQRPVSPMRATYVHVRRLAGRWEVFVECRRSADAPALPAGAVASLQQFDSWPDVRNVESVTLLIGADDAPAVALTIPEQGWHRLFAGVNDGTLQVHRRSHADRWYCRIVLPRSWLQVAEDDAPSVLVGCRRTHGDGDAVETTPNTSTPWRQAPARTGLDLGAWDELP